MTVSLTDYLNGVFTILGNYVAFLFNLQIMPGVSIGSILLVATLLFVIVANFWMRG